MELFILLLSTVYPVLLLWFIFEKTERKRGCRVYFCTRVFRQKSHSTSRTSLVLFFSQDKYYSWLYPGMLVCVIYKITDFGKLRRKHLFQSTVWGSVTCSRKSLSAGYKAAGHTAFTIRKRERNAGPQSVSVSLSSLCLCLSPEYLVHGMLSYM